MRSFWLRGVYLPLIWAAVHLSVVAAQPVASPRTAGWPEAAASPEARVLTGKERLGEKWKDEQRIDNCRVPPDKRGARARPDSCAYRD